MRRFFQFWRKDGGDGGGTYPLCRIRHATLHPGASLWTPGTSGGSLGGGAEDALAEAGPGGVVAVGFQTSAREQIHGAGVLARVEACEPFPDGVDPAGLGASRRYRLVGLARVQLLPDSLTHRRVPTIAVAPAEARPEDFAEPPPPLRAVLATLAALDHAWAPHWREAFELLGTEPLGQWATTLGWRLAPDERLALFDDPSRVAPLLLENLEAMHAGLAPEGRDVPAAILTQRATRRLTAELPHRWLNVEADGDGWAVFHPADLGRGGPDSGTFRRPGEPGAATNGFVYPQPEGGPVAVLVSHPARVAPQLWPAVESPARRILVRHGRLFIGASGSLARPPDASLARSEDSAWVDVPNGLYHLRCGPLSAEALLALAPAGGPDARSRAFLLLLEPPERPSV